MIMRTLVVAAAVVSAGLLTADPAPVASGAVATDDGPKAQNTVIAELAGFTSGIGQRQKGCHERIARFGESLLKEIGTPKADEIDRESQASKVEAAKAAFKAAGLARESAELELKAYLELTVPHELSTYEQELAEAEEDLNQARVKRSMAIERFEKIKGLLKDSASHLSLRYRFEVGGLRAELEQRRAGFAIEQVKSKRQVFEEYEKNRQTTELRSKIELARSDELRAKASMELGEALINRSRPMGGKNALSRSQVRVLELLNQALVMDGKVRAMLDQLSKNAKLDAGLQKEIAESTNKLEAIVDRAEDELTVGSLGALKESIERASRPPRRFRLPFSGTVNEKK
jgi:hypothetical protein